MSRKQEESGAALSYEATPKRTCSVQLSSPPRTKSRFLPKLVFPMLAATVALAGETLLKARVPRAAYGHYFSRGRALVLINPLPPSTGTIAVYLVLSVVGVTTAFFSACHPLSASDDFSTLSKAGLGEVV